jgi:hypothetical protein
MDLATKNNEPFIVDRLGEPAVVIMSVQDFIRTAAQPPDWLEKAWSGAKRRGLDTLTSADTEAEITSHRRTQDPVDDLGLPPAPGDPTDPPPILAAQCRVGHAAHQQREDRGSPEEKPGIEPQPAYRMTPQIGFEGASDL